MSSTSTNTTSNQTQLVNYLPSIKGSQKIYKYIQIIDSEIDKLYNLSSYRLSPNLTHAVANLVEFLVGKNKYNIDKKELIVTYLTNKFNLTETEKDEIIKQIDFIVELGAISPIPIVKKICLYVKSKFIN